MINKKYQARLIDTFKKENCFKCLKSKNCKSWGSPWSSGLCTGLVTGRSVVQIPHSEEKFSTRRKKTELCELRGCVPSHKTSLSSQNQRQF